MDRNDLVKRHISNLNRSCGNLSVDGNNKYTYILNSDDLMKSYYESKKDLKYMLKKETLRDRYLLYNASGLQKEIEELCAEALSNVSNEMAQLIAEDVANEVEFQLNGLVQTANGNITNKHSNKSSGKSNTDRLTKMLAKELVKGVSKIIDDIVDPKER